MQIFSWNIRSSQKPKYQQHWKFSSVLNRKHMSEHFLNVCTFLKEIKEWHHLLWLSNSWNPPHLSCISQDAITDLHNPVINRLRPRKMFLEDLKKNHYQCLVPQKLQKSPIFQLYDIPGMQTMACMHGTESKTYVNGSRC